MSGRITNAAANLFPGYFALVMATGIISIAAHLLNLEPVAWILIVINLVAYSILCLLLLIRLTRFFSRITTDLADHTRGPGFFTVDAATCVLGSQLLLVAGWQRIAAGLWFAGVLLWLVIMYAFFTLVTVRRTKPNIEAGLNGVWLLAVVATQSVSVLGTLLAGPFGAHREILLFFTLCMFLLGCMLYLPLITLIFYRFIEEIFTHKFSGSIDIIKKYVIFYHSGMITVSAQDRLLHPL